MIDDYKKKNVFLKNCHLLPFSLLLAFRSSLPHLRFNSDTPIRRVKTRREPTSHYRYRLIPRSVLNERPRSAVVLSSLFVRSSVKCHLLPAGADSHDDPSEFTDNYYSRYIAPHFRSFSSLFKPRAAHSWEVTRRSRDHYSTICARRYTIKFKY